jgi:tetratricopeptide (TPR) repeat protein
MAGPAPGAAPHASAEESESQRKRRADIFIDAAEMAVGQRDFTKASSLLDDAARFDAGSPAIAALRAQIAEQLAAEQASAVRVEEVKRLMAQARARLAAGDFDAARELAGKLTAIDPENWDVQSLAGRIHNAELAARQAKMRQEAADGQRQGSRATLWLVIAVVVIGAVAAAVYFAGR